MAALEDVLANADGFAETSDQERYDECEMVITRVLRDVRATAHVWKVSYFTRFSTTHSAIHEVDSSQKQVLHRSGIDRRWCLVTNP